MPHRRRAEPLIAMATTGTAAKVECRGAPFFWTLRRRGGLSEAMISLRSPPPALQPSLSPQLLSRETVRIRHPAYPHSTNILLSLPSADEKSSSTTSAVHISYGVHYRTVHNMCVIIPGNQFDCWIATDDHRQDRITEPADDDLLLGGDYWLFVPMLAGRSPSVP